MQTTATAVKYFNFSDSINTYLRDVRKHKTLTREEEDILFAQYKQLHSEWENTDDEGEKKVLESAFLKIRDEIIIKNQLFIFSMAKEYAETEEEILDYVSEGNAGIITAIDEFNPDHTYCDKNGNLSKGLRFITFAKFYIRRSMRNYMDSVKPLIQQTNSTKYKFKVAKIKAEFSNKEGRTPTVSEIADILKEKYGLEVKDLSDLYEMDVRSISMRYDDDDTTFEESDEFSEATNDYNYYDIKCENECVATKEFHMIENVLSRLKDKNRDIISKYFGIGYDYAYPLETIAEEYDMYPEDMEKIINKTINYIKQEVGTLTESKVC